MDIKSIEDWFLGYSRGFLSGDDSRDKPITLKIEHTFRVVENVRWLLEDERRRAYGNYGLIDADACVMAAYLHDVGRFEQYKRYGTFDDRASCDHGELSADIVVREGVLSSLDSDMKELILAMVHYHNRKMPPEDLSLRERVNLGVLRDADKMDVFHILSSLLKEGQRFGLSPSLMQSVEMSNELSPGVREEFMSGKLVSFDNVRTFEDLQLLRVSWIYDFDSPWALLWIWDNGYLQDIINAMEHGDQIYDIVAKEVEKTRGMLGKA